jgi:hypothetical protein
MKKNSLILIFLPIIAFSCLDKERIDFDYNSIPRSCKMTGKICIDSMMSPQTIDFYNSLIITVERTGSNRLKVYNTESGQEIQSIVRGGRGAWEMLQPWVFSSNSDTCWIFDLLTKKMIGMYKSDYDTLVSFNEFNLSTRGCEMVIATGNDTYIGTGYSDSIKMFSEFNSSGLLIRSFGDYPKVVPYNFTNGKQDALFYSTVYKNKIAHSPIRKMIAVGYTRFNMIDIFDIEGRLLKRINGPEKIEVKINKVSPHPGTVAYDVTPKYLAYRQMKAGPKEIWASHSGIILTRENYAQTIPHKIYCFSWEGKFIRELTFDIPIIDFSVDWEKKVLYCLSEELYPRVFSFSLNEII